MGEAIATTTLEVGAKERLLLDPIHQQSLARINEIEAPKPAPVEPEAPVYESPTITVQLGATPSENIQEGDSSHLEAQYTPVADPNLKAFF